MMKLFVEPLCMPRVMILYALPHHTCQRLLHRFIFIYAKMSKHLLNVCAHMSKFVLTCMLDFCALFHFEFWPIRFLPGAFWSSHHCWQSSIVYRDMLACLKEQVQTEHLKESLQCQLIWHSMPPPASSQHGSCLLRIYLYGSPFSVDERICAELTSPAALG